jgi:acyloxyacyl hydrolase
MNASEITESTYDGLFNLLLDEVDWPQRGGYTGFAPQTKTLKYADSMYKYMFERNHCNHRDYQNCCVNGARSGATNSTIIQTLARNPKEDKPLLLFLELIGNDVCNGHHTVVSFPRPFSFSFCGSPPSHLAPSSSPEHNDEAG